MGLGISTNEILEQSHPQAQLLQSPVPSAYGENPKQQIKLEGTPLSVTAAAAAAAAMHQPTTTAAMHTPEVWTPPPPPPPVRRGVLN